MDTNHDRPDQRDAAFGDEFLRTGVECLLLSALALPDQLLDEIVRLLLHYRYGLERTFPQHVGSVRKINGERPQFAMGARILVSLRS